MKTDTHTIRFPDTEWIAIQESAVRNRSFPSAEARRLIQVGLAAEASGSTLAHLVHRLEATFQSTLEILMLLRLDSHEIDRGRQPAAIKLAQEAYIQLTGVAPERPHAPRAAPPNERSKPNARLRSPSYRARGE